MAQTSLAKQESTDVRYRVLVVDDDPAVLRSVGASLEFTLDVVTCNSGERALELLQSGEFHVVCSDYAMPGMNGLELFERVARLPNPVACLLHTGSTSFVGHSRGVDQYVLSKPANPERLSALLVQLAQTAQLKRQATRLARR